MVRTPWNRNRTRPTEAKVPAEVEEYYQSTHKERVGVAWLLALATLILTLLIAVGIFFAGRWAFRTITHRGDDASQTQTENPATQETPNDGAGSSNATASNPPGNQSAPSSNTNNGSSNSSSPQTPAQGQPSSGSTTPSTGPSTPEIPHTGPDSNE